MHTRVRVDLYSFATTRFVLCVFVDHSSGVMLFLAAPANHANCHKLCLLNMRPFYAIKWDILMSYVTADIFNNHNHCFSGRTM